MDKATGSKGALEYGKFRRNRQGEPVIAVSNEDEIKVKTITITDSGNTALVPAESGKSIRVKGFIFSREGGSAVAVSLREDTDGDLKYTTYLYADGDYISKDFTHVWMLNSNKPLYAYASGSCNVHVTVEYEGPSESVAEGETLSDSIIIQERLVTDVGVNVRDSLDIAEAEIEGTGKVVTDAQTITETTAHVWAILNELVDTVEIVPEVIAPAIVPEVESQSLSDSIVIAEGVGNGVTLRLSDSITIDTTDMQRVYVNNPE